MPWLIGTTPDDETKELAREHREAGTTEGAEKQTVEDDEASAIEVTAVDKFGETSTKETATLLSEERPAMDEIETGGNSEESNEFGACKLKPARLLFVILGIVKESTLRRESLQAMSYACELPGLNKLGKPAITNMNI